MFACPLQEGADQGNVPIFCFSCGGFSSCDVDTSCLSPDVEQLWRVGMYTSDDDLWKEHFDIEPMEKGNGHLLIVGGVLLLVVLVAVVVLLI